MKVAYGELLPHPCAMCGGEMRLKPSKYGCFYGCVRWPACSGTVGAHKDTGLPLGTPATPELKEWRKRAHAAFDHLWMEGGFARGQAYAWLARRLDITRDECHIGMFDEEKCRKTVRLALEKTLNKA